MPTSATYILFNCCFNECVTNTYKDLRIYNK